MTAWTIAELEQHAAAVDAACLATPDIDHFCSSSAWIMPASQALMPPRRAIIEASAGAIPQQFFAAMANQHPDGFEYIEPLELAWGLASPLLGADVDACVALAVERLAREPAWRLALLAGIPAHGAHTHALVRHVPRSWALKLGQTSVRNRASLYGGIDGFMARRSPLFRKSLGKNIRKAVAAGITFTSVAITPAQADALFARIVACEQHSWKGRDGVGMSVDTMRDFYAAMLPMLARTGAGRLMFASLAGQDIAYVLGARLGDEYRGLQFSYHDEYANLSLGSLCQYHQIVALISEGVTLYDLGSEMEYKLRWAEQTLVTQVHVVIRPSP